MNSDISGFYKLPMKKRIKLLKTFAGLTRKDIKVLKHNSALRHETADMMIENVVSTMQLPLGIATHFRINGTDRLIPMAIEESSVVAAASHAAKLARPAGGFRAEADDPIMIGQIQLAGIKNMKRAKRCVLSKKAEIKAIANGRESTLIKLGGGLKDIELRELSTKRGKMLIAHLFVDVCDAMGANAVNSYCEDLAPYLEELTGGRAVLKIISNLAVKRMVRAQAVWKRSVVGKEIIDGILDACAFAEADKFRAATHNKGVMNAIDAVLIATCNDWRAAEAGAHAYAALHGYGPLTAYSKNKNGDLVGTIELPLAVGTIGGATKMHPVAQVALKVLGVKDAKELAETAACVGLANNFAALRAMVKEGIRKGHMKLHASNIAHMAGAREKEISVVASRLAEEGTISYSRARQLVKQVRRELRKKELKKLIRRVHQKVHKHHR